MEYYTEYNNKNIAEHSSDIGYSNGTTPKQQYPSYETTSEMESSAYLQNSDEESVIVENFIIIHPGSKKLRIGLNTNPIPIELPLVIAKRVDSNSKIDNGTTIIDNEEELETILESSQEILADRLTKTKKKPVYNGNQTTINFNSQVEKEKIPEHNDPNRIEWLDLKQEAPDFVLGSQVSLIPTLDTQYKLYYPIKEGIINTSDYSSISACLDDLELIFHHTINTQLNIPTHEFDNYSIVLIIPDDHPEIHVQSMLDLLLNKMQFNSVALVQESMCATFGAGSSLACVIDIGAQSSSISCVENGVCIPRTMVRLNYGGDLVTSILSSLLIKNNFPYAELNINSSYDWKLIEELKEKYCTLNESELAVQLYSFFTRFPNEHTYKYQIKMYDEAFHAPLSYFNPKALQSYKANKKASKFKLKEYYVSTLNNNDDFDPEPVLQKFTDVEPAFDDDYSVDLGIQGQSIPLYSNTDIKRISSMTPLDIAALHSITRLKDLDLMKKYFSNIILIGGGALVPGFSNTLQDRILTLASQTTNGAIEKVEVLSGAKELDPRLLCWKGGSIFSRLESCQEVLINSEEFNLFGLEGAKEKLVFIW